MLSALSFLRYMNEFYSLWASSLLWNWIKHKFFYCYITMFSLFLLCAESQDFSYIFPIINQSVPTPNLNPNLILVDEKEGCILVESNSCLSFTLFVCSANILLPRRRYLCVYTRETFMSVYKGLWSVLWPMRVCRRILLHTHLYTVLEISSPD